MISPLSTRFYRLKRYATFLFRYAMGKMAGPAFRDFVLDYIPIDSVCAEIGVWKGHFAQRMLERSPSRLHLIDPWRYLPEFGDRSYGSRGENCQAAMDAVYEEVAEVFRAESRVVVHRQFSHDAAKEFPVEYFDFVYIDGNHNYEFVKKDLDLFLPVVKYGGIIAGDDYRFDRCPNGGPRRAVKAAVASGELELITIRNNQYILRKP